MNPVTLTSSDIRESYTPVSPQKPGSVAGSVSGKTDVTGQAPDTLQLSPIALRQAALAGRVAGDLQSGSLTSDQGQQIYSQISSIHSQIATDRQADGGKLSSTDAAAIKQLQGQLSQTIYGDAHNGATAPSDSNVTKADFRSTVQAGRIVLNEKAGNLSSDQATQLGAQLSTIQQQIATDKQANGGTLSTADAQAINQAQNQLSQQIHLDARGATTPHAPVSPVS